MASSIGISHDIDICMNTNSIAPLKLLRAFDYTLLLKKYSKNKTCWDFNTCISAFFTKKCYSKWHKCFFFKTWVPLTISSMQMQCTTSPWWSCFKDMAVHRLLSCSKNRFNFNIWLASSGILDKQSFRWCTWNMQVPGHKGNISRVQIKANPSQQNNRLIRDLCKSSYLM